MTKLQTFFACLGIGGLVLAAFFSLVSLVMDEECRRLAECKADADCCLSAAQKQTLDRRCP